MLRLKWLPKQVPPGGGSAPSLVRTGEKYLEVVDAAIPRQSGDLRNLPPAGAVAGVRKALVRRVSRPEFPEETARQRVWRAVGGRVEGEGAGGRWQEAGAGGGPCGDGVVLEQPLLAVDETVTPSPSLLTHPLKVEGGAADSLVDG